MQAITWLRRVTKSVASVFESRSGSCTGPRMGVAGLWEVSTPPPFFFGKPSAHWNSRRFFDQLVNCDLSHTSPSLTVSRRTLPISGVSALESMPPSGFFTPLTEEKARIPNCEPCFFVAPALCMHHFSRSLSSTVPSAPRSSVARESLGKSIGSSIV